MLNLSSRGVLQVCVLAAALIAPVFAQTPSQCVVLRSGETACPAPESRCVQNRYGDWACSDAGGDAALDRYGNPVCGTGMCVKDTSGEVMCSTQPRGAAAVDRYGKAVCSGGCAPAAAPSCKPLTK
jgi:hypothetical protein